MSLHIHPITQSKSRFQNHFIATLARRKSIRCHISFRINQILNEIRYERQCVSSRNYCSVSTPMRWEVVRWREMWKKYGCKYLSECNCRLYSELLGPDECTTRRKPKKPLSENLKWKCTRGIHTFALGGNLFENLVVQLPTRWSSLTLKGGPMLFKFTVCVSLLALVHSTCNPGTFVDRDGCTIAGIGGSSLLVMF